MRTRNITICIIFILLSIWSPAQELTSADSPAELIIRAISPDCIRIILCPLKLPHIIPGYPFLTDSAEGNVIFRSHYVNKSQTIKTGHLHIKISNNPLVILITNNKKQHIQQLTFNDNGTLHFNGLDMPVLGIGEGGPRPDHDKTFLSNTAEFDRRGRLLQMQPRWQGGIYGSRNPAPMLVGTEGWAIFVAAPWGQIDLRNKDGIYIPWKPTKADSLPQTQENQDENLAKGKPPVNTIVAKLYDLFVFDAHKPETLMKDYSKIFGHTVLPPQWALGYMQSHRTLIDDRQMEGIIDTFRQKKIPVDAVIYLGTGFTPKGWNMTQPSFSFNPKVFIDSPQSFIGYMHNQHVKIVLHMVPFNRQQLPGLEGNIPPLPEENVDNTHIFTYWQQHIPLVNIGIDAFWPDEGDWFNLFERIKRHQLYYQGMLYSRPGIRPWSLQRNGYPGIARWGGWVWSGDTESSWKTLEAQIAVGLNYSLSIGPFWGSDIGGFTPTTEKTGELFARWFQFGAFCPSFRAHGKDWMTTLPWGWGRKDVGIEEMETKTGRFHIDSMALNNQTIEPIIKMYDELRYQLMLYTYTLAWQARTTGMPLMRAMWLQYPEDTIACHLGDQYFWGKELLIAPIYSKGATSRKLYLPAGIWYDWWTNDKIDGNRMINRLVDLKTMPIYVKAGAIIPVSPIRQYTNQIVSKPDTIRIYSGANGNFTLYSDDGFSQNYLKGDYRTIRFLWNNAKKCLTAKITHPFKQQNESLPTSFFVLLLPEGKQHILNLHNNKTTLHF